MFTDKKDSFIYEYIYEKMGVTKEQISSKSRLREVVDSRRLYMYLLRNYFGLTFHKIGRLVGNDHSSVIANCKRFEEYQHIYPKITDLPYKDMCFQLDIMNNSIDNQVEDLKEQIILINQKIDKLITIKQLTNGRRKKLHS